MDKFKCIMKGVNLIKKFRCITRLLLKEFSIFFNKNDLEDIINLYNQFGFKFYLDSYWLIVKTKNYKYKIGIIQEDMEYYWYLEPYNFSYFTTKYYDGKNEIKKLLFAIKENEELHMINNYNKKKVLVGDYNIFSRNNTLEVLNSFDLNVECVTSGTELIEKIKLGCKYDLIFTNNLYQDGYDGKKLIDELKKIPDFKIPIIVCTVDDNREYFINECKFDEHINKPLNKEKVKPILDKLLK